MYSEVRILYPSTRTQRRTKHTHQLSMKWCLLLTENEYEERTVLSRTHTHEAHTIHNISPQVLIDLQL